RIPQRALNHQTPIEALKKWHASHPKLFTKRVNDLPGLDTFLTIKGLTQGATRAEFEYPIPLVDAQALLQLCEGPLIEKTRYVLQVGATTWEVDEFHGENAPLVVAEVELPSEDAAFERPDWLGEEVTHDARYFNASLSQRPFQRW
uniref:CYTH domain-containing protein n=1 Tax=Ideonella sp. TaxID=1929293 RepID=UPI0037BF4281